MNAAGQKSLDRSMQAYRLLVRIYPTAFLGQFQDQLVQTFGDLARRALEDGGTFRLLLLWVRILPDLGVSAIQEHLGPPVWIVPTHVRLRWILACVLGFGVGQLAIDLSGVGPLSGAMRSLFAMLILGIFQSAWAFRRPAGEVARWAIATVLGIFALAAPFRFLANGFPPGRLSPVDELLFVALSGAGIGAFQFVMLPRAARKAWRWIPANCLGALGTHFATLALFYATNPQAFGLPAAAIVSGTVFGCLTCMPLASIVGVAELETQRD